MDERHGAFAVTHIARATIRFRDASTIDLGLNRVLAYETAEKGWKSAIALGTNYVRQSTICDIPDVMSGITGVARMTRPLTLTILSVSAHQPLTSSTLIIY
jgi:hypothetical protein